MWFIFLEKMEINDYFGTIEDPRINRKKLHSLETIFGVTIVCAICGIKSWEQMSYFAKLRESELSEWIDFSNGVPSHDTLERVYSLINPIDFHNCFVSWTKALCKVNNKLIAIDGKMARNSYDTAKNMQPLYLVNAWASENKFVLGQFKTLGKGHEIAGIKELLKILDIKGSIVSIDAIGCQKDIAEQIIDNKADYILSVKDNQELLRKDITSSFAVLSPNSIDEQTDKKSGRIEIRKCSVITNLKMLSQHQGWKGLQSIIQIESTRIINATSQMETRYYISSSLLTAKEFNLKIRGHWGIENSLHWILDVNFSEDSSRKRKGYSAENMALTNKIAINLLNNDIGSKLSMTHKRLKASHDIKYLKELFNFNA